MSVRKIDIVVVPDPQAVAVRSASFLEILAGDAVTSQEEKFVALSGGSTPRLMYHHLAKEDEPQLAALRRLNYFIGDERSVDNFHDDSNVKLAVGDLFAPARVPYRCLYAPNGGADDLGAEAARYWRTIRETLPRNAASIPRFDLIYLGMGNDGHTASLFPGTGALEIEEPGFVANRVPQLDTDRLTLTYPVINAAGHVLISLAGIGKASVLAEIMTGTAAGKYPIERITAPHVTWIVDEAAVASLTPEQIENYRQKGN